MIIAYLSYWRCKFDCFKVFFLGGLLTLFLIFIKKNVSQGQQHMDE